jgi:hypothetical protein
MAENEGGNNAGIVAILSIFVIVVILGVVGWRASVFGGHHGPDVDIHMSMPGASPEPK